ncbi:hypothetical protein [Mycoplana azooxidifex]|nr:hypothetical protein [Mycoplana azooxidifex]
MDRRRPRAVGIPGTLWRLQNGFITRGGDIERAKKFVATHTLPEGTFGLAELDDQLYVFGSAETAPAGLPPDIQYQRLQAEIPGGTSEMSYDMRRIYDVKDFDGKLYVVAGYENGSVHHYYDGTVISDWDTLAEETSSFGTVAQRLTRMINDNPAVLARHAGRRVFIEAKVPGVDFTLTTQTASGDTPSSAPTAVITILRANVVAVAEAKASGTIQVTGGSVGPGNQISALTVNGASIISAPVLWSSSDEHTANVLSIAINNGASVHGYDATVAGDTVTITAAEGLGATANGWVVAATVEGTAAVGTTNMSGGVTTVNPVAKLAQVEIGGDTFGENYMWRITLNGIRYPTTGRASRVALSVLVHKQRIWAPIAHRIQYSKLNDPTNWSDATASSGAGYIGVSTQTNGKVDLLGAAEYNGKVAFFARSTVVIYTLAADAQNIQFAQALENTGTLAAGSIVSYGANDVYYLDMSGVRSLRSRDGYDAAFASDIGNAIDPYIQELLGDTEDLEVGRAKSIVEGRDGRFFMAIGDQIVVLSYFPTSKITAWSYLDVGAPVDEIVRTTQDVYLRSGNTIYTYGGADRRAYPDDEEFPVVVETPFLSAQDPASMKQLRSYDHAASNVWKVEVLVDPNDETKTVEVGRLDGVTYGREAAWMPGYVGVFAMRYTCDTAGYASLSSTATHFQGGEKQ